MRGLCQHITYCRPSNILLVNVVCCQHSLLLQLDSAQQHLLVTGSIKGLRQRSQTHSLECQVVRKVCWHLHVFGSSCCLFMIGSTLQVQYITPCEFC